MTKNELVPVRVNMTIFRDASNPFLYLLYSFSQDLLVLLLGDVPVLVEGLDGQLDLLNGPLLHMKFLHVLQMEHKGTKETC